MITYYFTLICKVKYFKKNSLVNSDGLIDHLYDHVKIFPTKSQ